MGVKKITAMLLSMIMILVLSKVICEEAKIGTYNTAAVNLRTSPSIKSTSLGWVNESATCQILNEQFVGKKLWYYVKITSNTVNQYNMKNSLGWSQARYIDLAESTPSTNCGISEKSITHEVAEIDSSINTTNLEDSVFVEGTDVTILD